MGSFSHNSLTQLLSDNVVELVFVPRSSKNSRQRVTRRMLCTNNVILLNSIAGKIALGFNPPKGVGLKYFPKDKGLVVTFDLFWQEYRQIPLESVTVVSAIPLKSVDDRISFWEYFDKRLQGMSGAEKKSYMRR